VTHDAINVIFSGAEFLSLTGNDNLHDITVNRRVKYALRVDLTADTGTSLYADYMYFAVTREDYKYRLILGPYDDTSSLGKTNEEHEPEYVKLFSTICKRQRLVEVD